MSVFWASYDPVTGKIGQIQVVTDGSQPAAAPGHDVLSSVEPVSGQTHYVSGGAFVEKSANTTTIDKNAVTADGVDAVTLSNVPADTTVGISGPAGLYSEAGVLDGTLSVTFIEPGEYVIAVGSVQSMTEKFQVTANE